MLNALFPHYTYRRMILSTLARCGRGTGMWRQRLAAENWQLYRQYCRRKFDCNVCGQRGHPFFDFPDPVLRREHGIGHLRETLQCRACGATMRHRTLATMLLRALSARSGRTIPKITEVRAQDLAGLHVLDTDAFSPISRRLKQWPGYFISSFRPDLPFDTEIEPCYVNVNLEHMGFETDSFDIVMTSDVMEHVRGIENAHDEIARILRTGGQYIFTVPYDPAIAGHKILVDTSGEQDVTLEEPHYHGDPLTGGILAYRIFGQQIFADLSALGLNTELLYIEDDQSLILRGDVFVATKLAA